MIAFFIIIGIIVIVGVVLTVIIIKTFGNENIYTKVDKLLKNYKYKKALDILLPEAKNKIDDFIIQYYTGLAYEGLKDYHNAVAFYEKASLIASKKQDDVIKFQFYQKAADLYRKINKTKEALGYYLLILDKKPRNTSALFAVGEIFYNQGNYKKAKEYLEALVNINKEHIRGKYLLAKVYTFSNQWNDAQSLLESILSDPKFNDQVLKNEIYLLLAEIYKNNRNYIKAINVLTPLLSKKDYIDKVLIKLIDIYIKNNQLNYALTTMNKYINQVDNNKKVEIYYLIGNAYIRNNEFINGYKYLEEAYKINPNYSDLDQLIKKYSLFKENPILESIYTKDDKVFNDLCIKIFSKKTIKQVIKRDNFWIFELKDHCAVLYRQPYAVSKMDLVDIEKIIYQNIKSTKPYELLSFFGTVEDQKSNFLNNLKKEDTLVVEKDFKKMILISFEDFVNYINKNQK